MTFLTSSAFVEAVVRSGGGSLTFGLVLTGSALISGSFSSSDVSESE